MNTQPKPFSRVCPQCAASTGAEALKQCTAIIGIQGPECPGPTYPRSALWEGKMTEAEAQAWVDERRAHNLASWERAQQARAAIYADLTARKGTK